MQNRRDFLKTAAFATLGSGMVINEALAAEKKRGAWFNLNRKSGAGTQMKLRFFPYELKLRHVFTVATYSRSTTPDVQVELEYDGVIGYGEASMPPYLQKELGTLDSVMAFLKKVQDTIGRFSDPFQMEDILAYIDSLSESDAAAKAAVDIALHDLVGKLLQAPWYKIWGLDKDKAPSTTFTIGIDTPDVVREKTKECADRFNILKVKLGGDNDKEMIETIRSGRQPGVDRPPACPRRDTLAQGAGHRHGGAAHAQGADRRHRLDYPAESSAHLCRRGRPAPEGCTCAEGSLYGHQHQTNEVYRHARGVEDAQPGACARHEGDGGVHDGA